MEPDEDEREQRREEHRERRTLKPSGLTVLSAIHLGPAFKQRGVEKEQEGKHQDHRFHQAGKKKSNERYKDEAKYRRSKSFR